MRRRGSSVRKIPRWNKRSDGDRGKREEVKREREKRTRERARDRRRNWKGRARGRRKILDSPPRYDRTKRQSGVWRGAGLLSSPHSLLSALSFMNEYSPVTRGGLTLASPARTLSLVRRLSLSLSSSVALFPSPGQPLSLFPSLCFSRAELRA